MPGASLENDADVGKIWTLPCDYEINIAFKFGGVTYPVHPLDVSLDLNATDDSGDRICVGAVSLPKDLTGRRIQTDHVL